VPSVTAEHTANVPPNLGGTWSPQIYHSSPLTSPGKVVTILTRSQDDGSQLPLEHKCPSVRSYSSRDSWPPAVIVIEEDRKYHAC
jgi:hypothetical protein